MLMRVRRLAGSVVGAAFILLLSLSLLQTGQSINFGSIFSPSPVVVEVGDEVQRWNTLSATNVGATVNQIAAPAYIETGYPALATALALSDSWDGADFPISREQTRLYQQALFQSHVGSSSSTLSAMGETLAPSVALLSAQNLTAADLTTLLPPSLSHVPEAVVTRTYDFDFVRVFSNPTEVEVPEDSVLQAFLAENQERFQRPPTWAIEALVLNDVDVAAQIEVTEDQVRQYYNANSDNFRGPDRWEATEYIFGDETDTYILFNKIVNGFTLEETLGDLQTFIGTKELGPLTPEEYWELGFSYPVAIEPGAVSDTNFYIDGTYSLAYIEAMVPGEPMPLEEIYDFVAEALKLELAQEQLTERAGDLLREVNNENQELSFVAERAGYSTKVYEGLQSAQTAPEELSSAALFTRLEALTAPTQRPARLTIPEDRREVIYQVISYEDTRDLALEEGRDQILQAWQLEQAANTAATEAAGLIAQVEAGSDIATVIESAESDGLRLTSIADVSKLNLSQNDSEEALTLSVLDSAAQSRLGFRPAGFEEQQLIGFNPNLFSPFTLGDGQVQEVDLGVDGKLLIFATLKSVEADADTRPELIDTLAYTEVGRMLSSVLLLTYIEDVAADRPASVDSDIINERILAQRRLQAQHGG